ncbi:hypothetical protein TSMEX_004234 [Taenia solium]|eukprot:TsM_000309700 transcript=TsM_000309700 gene=TsM_000309700
MAQRGWLHPSLPRSRAASVVVQIMLSPVHSLSERECCSPVELPSCQVRRRRQIAGTLAGDDGRNTVRYRPHLSSLRLRRPFSAFVRASILRPFASPYLSISPSWNINGPKHR